MKINITFDLTPEEFRRTMGWPDVEQFQQELFKTIMEKMQAGEEGYDGLSLYQSMLKESMSGMSQLQNLFFNNMAGKQ